MASTTRACTPGPHCTRPDAQTCAVPVVTVAQAGQRLATTWYSVTRGGGGTTTSTTCRLFTP
ncbi:hypothetical protein HC028_15655 [Planosporangium flavigriseum]|uniref:hypothetical protein n=1 Tax=Planosporangium flavigriseum TaxID=373681 RepID=UPI00143C108D|nr:hypothetical protein [Planosporangium flavigriseum]NJC65926.1 hypothetical protein [Planosporangium flavigriseum]